MEVILKKTKITKSILNQTLRGNNSLFIDKQDYEILGWCFDKMRFILLYSKEKNKILKLPFILNYDYSVTNKSEQTRKEGLSYDDWYFPVFHYLNISFCDLHSSHYLVRSLEEIDVRTAEIKLKAFLNEVYEKGQIYL